LCRAPAPSGGRSTGGETGRPARLISANRAKRFLRRRPRKPAVRTARARPRFAAFSARSFETERGPQFGPLPFRPGVWCEPGPARRSPHLPQVHSTRGPFGLAVGFFIGRVGTGGVRRGLVKQARPQVSRKPWSGEKRFRDHRDAAFVCNVCNWRVRRGTAPPLGPRKKSRGRATFTQRGTAASTFVRKDMSYRF